MRDVAVVTSAARAALLLDPDRARLLAELAECPDSAAGLARRLGEKRQRLNYHLRALEAAGFIVVEEERAHGGLAERVFRPAAQRFLIDPDVAGGERGMPPERQTGDYLAAIGARLIQVVAAEAAGDGHVGALDVLLRLESEDDFGALVAELSDAITTVVKRYHVRGEGGRRFRLVAGIHPASS